MPTITTLYPETKNLKNMAQSASPSCESIATYSYSTAEARDNSSRQQCFGMVNLEFLFISSEESKIDVHISHPGKAAKFELQPSVELASIIGLSSHQVSDAQSLAESRQQEIINA